MNKQTQKANVLKLPDRKRRWRCAATVLVAISLASACAYGAARWMKQRNEIGTNLPLAPYSVCEACGATDATGCGAMRTSFLPPAADAGIRLKNQSPHCPAPTSLLEVGSRETGLSELSFQKGIPAEKSECALPACASLLEGETSAACQTESGMGGIGGKCVKGDDGNEK
jgi:hypothetical protein